jgi:hypothetical protein
MHRSNGHLGIKGIQIYQPVQKLLEDTDRLVI